MESSDISEVAVDSAEIESNFMIEGTNTSSSDDTSDLRGVGMHCGHGDLMGPLGLFVQGLLAFIAFTSLIVKRFCEPKHERRSWKVWFFDTSKQAIGAAVIHFANLFLADVFQGDPCTWYFVSFLLDSTAGLLVIYLGLKISQVVAYKKQWMSLILGEYGTPPQCRAWLGQCGIYILVMLVEKSIMTGLVMFNFWKNVRRIILSPIKNPDLEIVIVMFIVPFIVNALIFWVVDNFLKKKAFKKPVTNISTTENGVKYFKAIDRAKYFNNTNKAEDSESDVLLSLDEEGETCARYRGTENPLNRTISDSDGGSSQYGLLSPAIT